MALRLRHACRKGAQSRAGDSELVRLGLHRQHIGYYAGPHSHNVTRPTPSPHSSRTFGFLQACSSLESPNLVQPHSTLISMLSLCMKQEGTGLYLWDVGNSSLSFTGKPEEIATQPLRLCPSITVYLPRTVPYHAIPYRTVPYRTAPHRTAPHRTAPHRTVPFCTIPQHTVPHITSHHLTVPRRAAPNHTSPQRVTPLHTTPHRIAPQRTTTPHSRRSLHPFACGVVFTHS